MLEHSKAALELTQAWMIALRRSWCADVCGEASALEISKAVLELTRLKGTLLRADGMLWASALKPNKAVLEPVALEFEFSTFCLKTSIFH